MVSYKTKSKTRMKTILVTGGAGYIGSVAVKVLLKKGFNVVIIDNFSKGNIKYIPNDAHTHVMDLRHKTQLEWVFLQYKIDVVMHFAAYKAVEESMTNLVKYSDNIKGTINLLDTMVKFKVKKIIYSSSAAVYGVPKYTPINENHPTNPTNFYGFTKEQCEKLIKWYSKAYNMKYVILRYFNVLGDGGLNYVDPEPLNIIPLIMDTIFGKRYKFDICGTDYETKDGTCIRDYIDVNDLVDAHIRALKLNSNEIINLGTSNGTSVKELVQMVIDTKKSDLFLNLGFKDRREGDVPILIASNAKAKDLLGWKPKTKMVDTIKSILNVGEKNEKEKIVCR